VVPKFDENRVATIEALDEPTYRKLHGRAATLLRREVPEACMEPADLLHEALLRIASGRSQPRFQNMAHLIAVATLVMRRVLIDRARGSSWPARQKWLPLDSQMAVPLACEADSVAFRDILHRLANFDERLFAVVEMRFYWGLGVDEIASVLSISSRTVKRDWTVARGWLRHKIGQSPHRAEALTRPLPTNSRRSTRIPSANEWIPPFRDQIVLRQSA
jgi:RNA polymerase sigma-70 factor, ECF subfamily